MQERRAGSRKRSFLKGTIYFNNRLSSTECVIRDFSETGARLELNAPITLPDAIELFIPAKDQTLRAQIRWRSKDEIGVSFAGTESAVESESLSIDVARRIDALERDVAKLQRIVMELRNDFRMRRGDT